MKLFFYIAALLSFVFSSCTEGQKVEEKKMKASPPVWVTTELVNSRGMSSQIVITGSVKPNTKGVIKSPVNGVVTELNVRENYAVNKGDIVLVINPSERVALIAKHNQELNLLRRTIKKTTENTDSIRTLIYEAEKKLKFAESMYQSSLVTTEVEGLVSVRYIDKGSEVSAKDPLLEIFNPKSLVVKAEVNESYFSIIKKGKILPVKLMAYPDRIFQGRITLVYPQINELTRSIMFDLTLDENVELLEGMLAEITLTTESRHGVIAITDDAIMSSHKGDQFVFIAETDSTVYRRNIKTGLSSNGFVEILEGIEMKDQVVVKGQEVLKDGLKVKITDTKKKK